MLCMVSIVGFGQSNELDSLLKTNYKYCDDSVSDEVIIMPIHYIQGTNTITTFHITGYSPTDDTTICVPGYYSMYDRYLWPDEIKYYNDRTDKYLGVRVIRRNLEQSTVYGQPINISKPIYERYIYGDKLNKSGNITLSLGIVSSVIGTGLIIGGICAQNNKKPSNALYIAGGTLLFCGGITISVGIPLILFGKNIKGEANTLYRLSK